MKHLILFAFTSILIISACKTKEKTIITDGPCNSCEDAVVYFYGDPALDGCGWVVDVSSTIYKPSNLPVEFNEDKLEVRIKYKVLDSVRCGMMTKYKGMYIEEIVKKE